MDIRLKDILTTHRDSCIETARAYNALGAIAATEGNIELVNVCSHNALEFARGAQDAQEQIQKLTELFGAAEAKAERYKIYHFYTSELACRIFDTREDALDVLQENGCSDRCKIVPESEWDAY